MSPGKKQEDGSFRREFSKGTAVYNPPGNKPVTVVFDDARKCIATTEVGKRHAVDTADGGLFLKTR